MKEYRNVTWLVYVTVMGAIKYIRFPLCHSKPVRRKWRAAGATSKRGSNSGGVRDMEPHARSR